jgi:hypothetical protein
LSLVEVLVVCLTASIAAACEPSGDVAENDRKPNNGVSSELESLARALAGDDVRIARIFDREASRWALGVERGDAALKAAEAAPGTDVSPAHLLLVLDSQARTASWPIGAGRAIDAALTAGSSAVGYIDAESHPCLVAGWAPTCSDRRAEPVGLDVSTDGRVVFAAADEAGTHLYELGPSATAPRRLTKGLQHHNRPLFDPTGLKIAYVANAGGLASLFVLDLATETTKQLTNAGKSLGAPGQASRKPPGFIPAPTSRAAMSWDTSGIHYQAGETSWRVDPATGAATQEVPQ